MSLLLLLSVLVIASKALTVVVSDYLSGATYTSIYDQACIGMCSNTTVSNMYLYL